MIEKINENRQYTEGNANRQGESMSQDNSIPASDANRNEERDNRIKQEEDTARLRSERQSVQDNNPE
jgi:hypothetical protein